MTTLGNTIFSQIKAMVHKTMDSLEHTVEFARKRELTEEEIAEHLALIQVDIDYTMRLIEEGATARQ